MKPILTRTWEGTWWHRTVAVAMLAALLLAAYGAFSNLWSDDEPEPSPIRRAYEVNCEEEPSVCEDFIEISTVVIERD